MRTVILLLGVFTIGIVVSVAASGAVFAVMRALGLVPRTDAERAAAALITQSGRVLNISYAHRFVTALAGLVLPFSVSIALGIAAILPNTSIRPAASLLQEEVKEEPLRPEMTRAVGPPDVWSAFSEVERDISIAAHYYPHQAVICSSLLANSAGRMWKLLQRSKTTYSPEVNGNVIALQGYTGAIDQGEVEGIYKQLADKVEALNVGTEKIIYTGYYQEMLEKVRERLDHFA